MRDPFVTDELEDQRLRQRRRLRAVPEWFLERVAKGLEGELLAVVTEADRACCEAWVRAAADRAGEELPSELLQRMERTVGAMGKHAIAQVLNDLAIIEKLPVPIESWPFEDLIQQARATLDEHVRHIPDELQVTLVRFVVLLLLADELSEDGYRDPRIVSAERPADA